MASLLTYALTNLADVKESLGIASGVTTQDNLIIRKVNQATEIIEGYCGRRFALTSYTNEEYDGTGTEQIVLRNRPVVTFTQIQARTEFTNTDSWVTLQSNEYWTDLPAGIISAIGRFYGRHRRWRVSYTAGYTTIPSDIAEACVIIAAYLVQHPVPGNLIQRQKEGGREIHYNINMPRSLIEALGLSDTLDRYAEPMISGLR